MTNLPAALATEAFDASDRYDSSTQGPGAVIRDETPLDREVAQIERIMKTDFSTYVAQGLDRRLTALREQRDQGRTTPGVSSQTPTTLDLTAGGSIDWSAADRRALAGFKRAAMDAGLTQGAVDKLIDWYVAEIETQNATTLEQDRFDNRETRDRLKAAGRDVEADIRAVDRLLDERFDGEFIRAFRNTRLPNGRRLCSDIRFFELLRDASWALAGE